MFNFQIIKPPAANVVTLARLPQAIFADFKRQLGGSATSFVTAQTSEIQAGFMLGIQHALSKLEEGFVIETPTTGVK